LLVAALGGPTFATAPSLGGISPRGVQRGTDAVLLFNGARLGDAQEVLFYSPGVAVSKLEKVNDNQVKAAVKVAPDCRLGEHVVRLRTAGGVSEMRTVWVGPFPVLDEKEPNSDFDKPQLIPLNVTVQGQVDSEDNDYFAVKLKKGQRLSVEIEGMRLGNAFFDPFVAILDSKRFELASSDDAPLLGQDACVSVVAPADGTYVVQVRDSAYTGAGAYRLHVGTFPRPLAVVPAGGRPGEELEVTFLGDPTGPIKQKVKVPAEGTQTGVFCQDAGGVCPSPIPFRILAGDNVVETAGNDKPATATPFAAPGAVNGVISKPGETDHYRFKAKKGQNFDVHCYARRLGSPLDSVMYASVMGGGAFVGNDDAVGPDSYFRFAAPQDGEYVLTVTDHLHKGGPTYFYRVELTEPGLSSTLSIPKVSLFSQERQAIAVPRGNRMATLVTVSRGAWGGDAVLGATDLPPGAVLQAETMPGNLDTIPVVFEAGPAATPAGRLAHLTATPAEANLKGKVPSKFHQMAELVTGGPGQSVYWKVEVDREAVVVTDEVPFHIEIVEPKVPLVQNGSMNLRVVARRKPGYKEPITIVPLFNPPGVGSASSATIPADKDETVLPLSAAPGAQVRKWKTAVLGVANVGGGPVWVSSQLATLEVAPPFVAFAMERAASEQGKNTEMFTKVQVTAPFPGAAKVHLVGLPPKVTTPELEITKDTKDLAFKLTVDRAAPPGQHRNIFCQVVVTANGEPILHNVGGTELRIDVPLPPKPNAAPPPKVAAAPQPAQPAKAPEKRLTRLEKLRLEQQDREKAAQGGKK
jgi:hypothetical protein